MTFIRALLLLVACVLPLQSVQADLSALSADAPMAAMSGVSDEMPCDQPGCDCCDEACPQMAFCPLMGAVYLPVTLSLDLPLVQLSLHTRAIAPVLFSAHPALPFRPPIFLDV